jgi:hypothetical protein
MVWEAVFMLIVLKIPVAYLCLVVWWAIRSEPRDAEPAALVPVADTPSPEPRGWSRRRRGGPPRPGPVRRPAPARPAVLRARARR